MEHLTTTLLTDQGLLRSLAHRRYSLIVYHREGAEIVPLRQGVGVVVGRVAPADVTVQDPSLSRVHARFTLGVDEVLLEDLGATNGVWVRGERVEQATLRAGEGARLGMVRVAVHALGAEEGPRGLLGHDRFVTLLEDEVVRARFLGRPLAVLMVRTSRNEGAHVEQFAPELLALLRPIDRAALYSADTLEIVLPETSAEAARAKAEELAQRSAPGRRLFVGYAATEGGAAESQSLLGAATRALAATGLRAPVVGPELEPNTLASAGASLPLTDDGAPVAKSAAMKQLFAQARKFAGASLSVLVLGETGTGKEVIARALHEGGPRQTKRFIALNCAAIPPTLVESTLFGHERGAFSGATNTQLGVFESAKGGTVFLDEVGELPLAVQATLLRVLEQGTITRVGSTRELEVDVRVVAATNRDLEAMVAKDTFRADLHSRLAGATLVVPPLRERRDDIVPLAQRFFRLAKKKNPSRATGFSAEALALLESYSWPTNARELRNAVERAVVIAEGELVTPEDLPERVRAAGVVRLGASLPAPKASGSAQPAPARPAAIAAGSRQSFKERLRNAEREILIAALAELDNNQTETARRLAMPLRTLQYKLRELGIRRGDFRAD